MAPKAERVKRAVEAVTEIKASVAKSNPVAKSNLKSQQGGKRAGAGRKPNGVRAMTAAERMATSRARKAAVTGDVGANLGLEKTPTMSAMGGDGISGP
jgi:hypothetical protein